MFRGIVFALSACFIWGLIYVVPQLFMSGFSSMEVVLGRYFMYGLISSIIFCKAKMKNSCRYPKEIWIKALYLSLIITIVFYTFVVLGLRYSSPAVCTLILGIGPITIAFYGNWKQKEISFRSLIIPSALIILGLVIINIHYLEKTSSFYLYFFGIFYSFLALILWSWYVVVNSTFLKKHPEISSKDWSTINGLTTLFWTLVYTIFLILFFPDQFNVNKYFILNQEFVYFIFGSSILGFLCSWMGAFLWNRASLDLPVSLAGQLSIFETIFGIIFVYIAQRHLPLMSECIGVAILLTAIIYGIRQFTKKLDNQLVE